MCKKQQKINKEIKKDTSEIEEKKEESKDSENKESKDSENKESKDSENKKLVREKNMTFLNSIYTNFLYWIVLFISLFIISDNFLMGTLTFFTMYFLAYFVHVYTHEYDTLFTKIHEYHHSHTNLFSHIIQLLLELSIPTIFIPLYNKYNFIKNNIDIFVLAFTTLLYSSVHNINYGYFKVNNVHSIHHMRRKSNYGPDLCDVLFNTKDILNNDVENTSHHIPNMIILTIVVKLLKSESILSFSTIKNIFMYFTILNLIFLLLVSIYLFIKKNKNINMCFNDLIRALFFNKNFNKLN